MHDPRRTQRISARDIDALTFIGEGFEVAQYQLHAAVFPTVSAVVVSNFVRRAIRNGWIAAERWNRVGINRLRLTKLGRDLLVDAGGDATALFVPRHPVASKDVAHTLWINDLRVVISGVEPRFDTVLPAWQLQRRFSPAPAAIPDVLAIRAGTVAHDAFVAAFEIDLGGERLANVFLPKLHTLRELVNAWSSGTGSAIVVLTTTSRRVAAINEAFGNERVTIKALQLPPAVTGCAAVHFLRAAVADVLAVNTRPEVVLRLQESETTT